MLPAGWRGVNEIGVELLIHCREQSLPVIRKCAGGTSVGVLSSFT
jgi:hypothetical protein